MVNTTYTNVTTGFSVLNPSDPDGTTYFTADANGVTVNGSVIAPSEIAFLDGVTAGTVTASKAVVVDANKDISSFRNLTTTGTLTTGAISSSDNHTMTAATKTLVLKQGANGKTGTFTLNGVTPVTVSNTSITANSGILITLKTVGGTVGAHPAIQTITASTGFTVAGTASDTSVYNYHIIESAA